MLENEKNDFRNHYRKESGEYDKNRFSSACDILYDKIIKETYTKFTEECEFLLDAGCGTGRLTLNSANKNKKVIALDSSPEVIKILKQKAISETNPVNIDYIIGDLENLPFKPNSFDGVQSFAVLRHIKYPDRAISELKRTVKDDGKIIVDFLNKDLFIFYEFYRKLNKKNPNVPNEHFFKNYYFNLKEISKLFKDNGIIITNSRAFRKFPAHLFLCRIGIKSLEPYIERYEKGINFGSIVIIQAEKIHDHILL